MEEQTTPKVQLHVVRQRITIDVNGPQATIRVEGLEQLQVIMLLSQFIGMTAAEIKKSQSRIVVPEIVVK